jgi:alkyl hydroperoxide reductase subunit AhpF
MEKMLEEGVVKQIREVFQQLKDPVAVLFFGSAEQSCEYCEQTLQMLEEVTAISELLSLYVYDLEVNASEAKKYHVDKVPGIVLAAKKGDEIADYGVRLAGIPAGGEFSTLIHDLVLISKRDSGLKPETRKFLKSLKKPVNLQVFVTPT